MPFGTSLKRERQFQGTICEFIKLPERARLGTPDLRCTILANARSLSQVVMRMIEQRTTCYRAYFPYLGFPGFSTTRSQYALDKNTRYKYSEPSTSYLI